jgi:protein associated with RNAse G/E
MQIKHYYKDGSILDYWNYAKILHREDGPAVEYVSGNKAWFVDGKRHRVDGPAVEYADGSKMWFINGKWLTEEQFNNHPKVQHYKFQLLLEEVLCER